MVKTLLILLFPTIFFASCCAFAGKCDDGDYLGANFRIVSKTDGSDLLFGAAARYDDTKIRFFSLKNGDTIAHYSSAGINPHGSGDSILSVGFDYRKPDTVFVMLDQNKADTLILQYNNSKGSACCASVAYVVPARFNGILIQKMDNQINLLTK